MDMSSFQRKIRSVFKIKKKKRKKEIWLRKIKSVFVKEKKWDLIWEKSDLFFCKVKKKWDFICKNQIYFLKGKKKKILLKRIRFVLKILKKMKFDL